MHGSDEEPRPESSDRWRIQAEQMPPFREVVETTCQSSVYVRRAGWVLAMSHLVRLKYSSIEDSRPAPESRTTSRQPFQSSPFDKLRAGSAGLFHGACQPRTVSWAKFSRPYEDSI